MSLVAEVEGFALSSRFGDGNSLGQPLGVKSVGFVRIRTSDGVEGVGETYAGVYAPELIAPCAEFLAGRVKALSVDEALERLNEENFLPFVGGSGLLRSVASALDTALWDAKAQAAGQPLWKLLPGTARACVPVYASGGSAAFSPQAVADDAKRLVAAGHRAFKMRVGFQDWTADLERVRAAREALGDRALMVDAIMGTVKPPWSVETARAKIAELARFSPAWVEEPVPPSDIAGLARVAQGSPVPVASGEAWSSPAEFEYAISAKAAHILQPDATHCGGVTATLAVCDRARAAGLKVALHVWGSAVAVRANLHVALARPEVDILEIPSVSFELSKELEASPLAVRDGAVAAPSEPGLGTAVSREARSKFPFVPGSGYVWGARAKK